MAVPSLDVEEYGAVPDQAAASGSNTRLKRVGLVALAMMLTMAAALALLASPAAEQTQPIEDLILSPEDKLRRMVDEFVAHGTKMSLQQMEHQLDAWRHDPDTMLDLPVHDRTQQLMGMASAIHTTSLYDSSLCAKKTVILSKFDELLKRLAGEELNLNISYAHSQEQLKDAEEAYLDSEATYRLTVQRTEQAKEGAQYAEQQFEKYSTAFKEDTSSLKSIESQDEATRQSLLQEQQLIQMIMRMIGVLNATKSEARAVGGATQLAEEDRPPLSSERVQAQLKRLESLSLQAKQPHLREYLHQLKMSLAQYAETDAVAAILNQMLQDIADRLRVMNNLKDSAQTQADTDKSKETQWQTKLVDLSNAEDKAKAESQSQELQREKLAGTKKSATQTATEEKAAYKMTLSPYIKEIYIINLIKGKIASYCAEQAAAAVSGGVP